jgi:hypothetical protein
MPCGHGQNKTPPVADTVLQPMLAAARYLVDTLGPHAIDLITQVRDAARKWSHTHGDHVFTTTLPTEEITQLLADYEHRGEPLPLAAEHTIRDRMVAGWSPEDPLTRISLGLLARQAGFTQSGGSGSRTCVTGSKRPCTSSEPRNHSAATLPSSTARTRTAPSPGRFRWTGWKPSRSLESSAPPRSSCWQRYPECARPS